MADWWDGLGFNVNDTGIMNDFNFPDWATTMSFPDWSAGLQFPDFGDLPTWAGGQNWSFPDFNTLPDLSAFPQQPDFGGIDWSALSLPPTTWQSLNQTLPTWGGVDLQSFGMEQPAFSGTPAGLSSALGTELGDLLRQFNQLTGSLTEERTPPQPETAAAPETTQGRLLRIYEQMAKNNQRDWVDRATGLGTLGLNAAGALSKFLDTGPKMDPLQKAKLQAEIDAIRAQTAEQNDPLRKALLQAQIDAANAAAERARAESGQLNEPPAQPLGAPAVTEFKGVSGLLANDARFDALYQQVLKETTDLPKPDPAYVAQRAAAIRTSQAAEIEARYQKQQDQILEMSNRLGTNPAGQLAEMESQKQRELAALDVSSQTQALAEIQAQQSMLVGRLTPAVQLLAQVNPAASADVLARIYATMAVPKG